MTKSKDEDPFEEYEEDDRGGGRVLLSLACVIIIIAGLKLAAGICVPVAMGLFLGVLSMPILNFFDTRCRMPRPLAVISTILIDLLLLGGIVYVLSGVIPELQRRGPEYAQRLQKQAIEYSQQIDTQLEKFESWGTHFGIDTKEGSIPTFQEMVREYWNTDRMLGLINSTSLVERFTSLASQSFFVVILMIFVLAESKRYSEKVRGVLDEHGPDLSRFQRSTVDIQHYLLLKAAVSLLTGILAWISCLVIGVEFALLWGVVAFLLNFIPVIGSIVAALPPVIVALVMQGFWPAAIVLICYLGINICIGNFLEPKLLGDSFGISTIVVILSVLVWGFIWGAAGMFLAVPLTMMVKVWLDNTPELRWISVLISSGGDDDDDKPIWRLEKKLVGKKN